MTATQQLETARSAWSFALLGSDINCVHEQLTQLSIDIASYSIVFAGMTDRRKGRQGRLRNPLLIEMVSRGFATLAATALRRQADSFDLNAAERGRDTSVYGLAPILKDMLARPEALTRANMLQAELLPFDYLVEEAEFARLVARRVGAGGTGHPNMAVPRWMRSKDRHEAIDRLTGTCPATRTANDQVPASVLTRALSDVTSACARAKSVVDQYIAHASTEPSRASRGSRDAAITLTDIHAAHRTCCQVTLFLVNDLLGSSCGGFMPVFAYDHLARIGLLLNDASRIDDIRRAWDAYKYSLDTLAHWPDSELHSAQTLSDE